MSDDLKIPKKFSFLDSWWLSLRFLIILSANKIEVIFDFIGRQNRSTLSIVWRPPYSAMKIRRRPPYLVDPAVCHIGEQFEEIVSFVSAAQQCIGDVMTVDQNHMQVMSVAQVRQLRRKIHIAYQPTITAYQNAFTSIQLRVRSTRIWVPVNTSCLLYTSPSPRD